MRKRLMLRYGSGVKQRQHALALGLDLLEEVHEGQHLVGREGLALARRQRAGCAARSRADARRSLPPGGWYGAWCS